MSTPIAPPVPGKPFPPPKTGPRAPAPKPPVEVVVAAVAAVTPVALYPETSRPAITTVSVTYDRKQNLGDFSSANVGVTIWADVQDTSALDETMQQLWTMAKANVRAQLEPLTRKQNGASINVAEMFLGLPVQKD